MKKLIYSILSSLIILIFTGCSKDGSGNGPLDGTTWVRTYSYYSQYSGTTINYRNTLKFGSVTYTLELYSDYSSSPGVYSTTTGVYDVSDYPTIIMIDDDGDVHVVEIEGNQLTRSNGVYYKQ